MKRRLSRAVVPAIGLLAVTGALALVATAPVVLFSPSNEAGSLPSAPAASSEVARVTASPNLHPQGPAGRAGADETPGAPAETSTSGPLAATPPIGGAGGGTTDKTAPPPRARAGGPAAEEPTTPKQRCERKNKGKGNGYAKGHCKPKHHGKAKGHSKQESRGVVAFAPRGTKAGHVSPSRAGKHPGRSARPHARARR
jgi:hypothetical protein